MPKRTPGFKMVDVGDSGRRATAFLVEGGCAVAATDADVAGRALAAILEALKQTNDPRFEQAYMHAEAVLSQFPAVPGPYIERSSGTADVDIVQAVVGYAWVRPSADGHICGGALFYPATKTGRAIDIHTFWIGDGETLH